MSLPGVRSGTPMDILPCGHWWCAVCLLGRPRAAPTLFYRRINLYIFLTRGRFVLLLRKRRHPRNHAAGKAAICPAAYKLHQLRLRLLARSPPHVYRRFAQQGSGEAATGNGCVRRSGHAVLGAPRKRRGAKKPDLMSRLLVETLLMQREERIRTPPYCCCSHEALQYFVACWCRRAVRGTQEANE